MRKFKTVVAGRVYAVSRRPVIRPLDDGIMAIPILPKDRADAHAEMREYIRRRKEKGH